MREDLHLYREAFRAYLRHGTSMALSIKEARPTSRYIWRTQGDDRVRPSHAANEGRIFAWDDPPPTGHPGEDFGCRCTAEPYYPEIDEYITIGMSGISDQGPGWGHEDFIWHYFFGGGRSVTVRDTGYLNAVVAQYMDEVGKRLRDQIADAARKGDAGAFTSSFERPYDMGSVAFSFGSSVIGGVASGRASQQDGVLTLAGDIDFYFRDEFADPANIGGWLREEGLESAPNFEIPFGTPYPITDEWSGRFEGRVYVDRSRSVYFHDETKP